MDCLNTTSNLAPKCIGPFIDQTLVVNFAEHLINMQKETETLTNWTCIPKVRVDQMKLTCEGFSAF